MSQFRVLQFNMQFGQIWDETYPDRAPVRLEETLAEIRRHDADLILLQEVEQAKPGGEQTQPPPNYTRLKRELTAYDSWFSYPKADPRELPFGIGLAIFSRTPLRDLFRLDLPSPPIEFEFFGKKMTPTDRLLIGAKTTVIGRELQLFNTHLLAFFMLGSSSTTNPFQRNLVAEQLAKSTGPTILTGDFNVSQHGSLVKQFAARGFATVQDSAITWRRRPFVLDHIFYNPALRCVGHRVRPTPASDHHALTADFEFV
ncbi:endonuclease/exonuclease/phosphatase family protein [Horticoccus sp. 23ND18S-11]|uniref:endonuclease/exonuclease/phosphatase family protein n=1 Tax=Horticoccus sp. 23ND18S-11 TaxID=3391832 RepID=UPI0039C8C699